MKKLMIVDDDVDLLEAMEMVFTSYGYTTRGVSRASEAYALAGTYQPDLILLDYLLSGTYGTDICRKLSNAIDTSHIPVIMFSAHPDAREAVDLCGAVDFIAKPFSVAELISKVQKLVGK